MIREYDLPEGFKKNVEINIKDINELKSKLLEQYKYFCRRNKKTEKYYKNRLIDFRKYCIVQYIRHLDWLYYSKASLNIDISQESLDIELIDKTVVFAELKEFLFDIFIDKMNKFSDDSLKGSITYLIEHRYIKIEKRKFYPDSNSDEVTYVESYTCADTGNYDLLDFIKKFYLEDIVEIKDFCLKLNTKQRKKANLIVDTIKEEFPNDYISVEAIQKNSGFDSQTYIRIVCTADSILYKVIYERWETNLSKGQRKGNKKKE